MIKNLPFQLKHTYLVLRKRHYRCSCGKNFYETYDFLSRYQQRTRRLSFKAIELLHNSINLISIAEQLNLSVSTISKLIDTLNYEAPCSLPSCISIDVFKGDTNAGKYQCILVDGDKNRILDIMPDRSQSHISKMDSRDSKCI